MGPFDNDKAADWCADLHDAEPPLRPGILREALSAVAEEDGYLDSRLAVVGIAAAAIVASQWPGGAAISSPFAPDFLVSGELLPLPEEFGPLALRALDRIVATDSEWRDLWADGFPDAAAELEPIRAALDG